MKNNFYPVLNNEYILRLYEIENENKYAIYNIYKREPIQLNEDGLFIVEHFTGEHTVNDILNNIISNYSISLNETIEKLNSILLELEKKNIIHFNNYKKIERRFYEKKKMRGLLNHVYILLTNACNLKCKHCSVDAGKKLKNELEKDQFIYLIDQISEMMVPAITFTGGEPTLIKYLPELIDYASQKPMKVCLMTNGFTINNSYAKLLVDNKLSQVNISIDGINESTHDNFRGIPGSFRKAMEAIKIFKDLNIYVETTTVIHENNGNEIEGLVNFGKKIGINNMKFIPIVPYKRGKNCDFNTSLQSYTSNIKNFLYYLEDKKIINKKNLREKIQKEKLYRCNAGEGTLTIESNGNVYPCNNFQTIIFGNIKTHSLYDIYMKPKNLLKLMNATQFQNSDCELCDILDECRGGCPMTAYSYFGFYNKCDITRKPVVLELIKNLQEGRDEKNFSSSDDSCI